MFNRCKHKWVVLVDRVTESTFENAIRVSSTNPNKVIPHQLCHDNRKHITILSCTECGNLDKTITKL
jgi:hypothetical protein